MNFNVDCQQSEDPCLTKVVPLLVLVKEWGELGDDAFKEIDIVLLLLQGVQQADADKVGCTLSRKCASNLCVIARHANLFIGVHLQL